MIKVAIIGPPGSGKTTLSSGIFYHLKIKGKKVELVPELVKYKVYKGMSFTGVGFDIQNTLEQKELEETIEGSKSADIIVCEAPLCNGYFYSSFYKKELESPILREIAKNKINTYDVIFFVKRVDETYEQFGRKEDSKTSLLLEEHIQNKIKELNYEGAIYEVSQKEPLENILKIVLGLN